MHEGSELQQPLGVYLTTDVEVWPTGATGWPHRPLPPTAMCTAEIEAYLFGRTRTGEYGVPYQLAMLRNYGLKGTFFVDPLFSFALGIDPLAQVVRQIEAAGQLVALHLHPEWLTDPRCQGLPAFRGPMLHGYSPDEQTSLIQIGLNRLREAGASPANAFRAGSWGADLSTLTALGKAGITVDCSLNARMPQSFPSRPFKSALQEPVLIDGLIELPASRLADGRAPDGRVLSFVGSSAAEIKFALCSARDLGRRALVIVLHSNEFVRTEALGSGRQPGPRRTVVRRFEDVCRFLARSPDQYPTAFVTEAEPTSDLSSIDPVPKSHTVRTALRQIEQLASRWF